MISIKNIHKSFNGNKVLNGINLEIDKGEVVSIIGPSGTGKTTLLRCINFLERPDEGEINLSGFHLNSRDVKKKDVLYLRKKTSMVFQHYNLFRNKTVFQNVMEPQIVVHKKSKEEAKERTVKELENVDLLEKAEYYPSQLSGGQQQRVGIARALAVDPEVILFDEPTSALDPELVDGVLQAIAKVAKSGMTILLVTHEMEFAREISDKVVFMETGKIVEEGKPKQIFEDSNNLRTRDFLRKYYK